MRVAVGLACVAVITALVACGVQEVHERSTPPQGAVGPVGVYFVDAKAYRRAYRESADDTWFTTPYILKCALLPDGTFEVWDEGEPSPWRGSWQVRGQRLQLGVEGGDTPNGEFQQQAFSATWSLTPAGDIKVQDWCWEPLVEHVLIRMD